MKTGIECPSNGQRQHLAIAPALRRRARMVVMGESTTVLGARGTAQVLDLVHHSRGEGVTVLLMSYAMEDITASTDRATILHPGRRLATVSARGQTAGSLAHLVRRMANARPPMCRPS